MNTRKPHMRHKNTANYILYFMGVFLIGFVIVMTITFWKYESVPDTLIQYVLGASGIESIALALIKATKVKHEKKDDSTNNDDLDSTI